MRRVRRACQFRPGRSQNRSAWSEKHRRRWPAPCLGLGITIGGDHDDRNTRSHRGFRSSRACGPPVRQHAGEALVADHARPLIELPMSKCHGLKAPLHWTKHVHLPTMNPENRCQNKSVGNFYSRRHGEESNEQTEISCIYEQPLSHSGMGRGAVELAWLGGLTGAVGS